jgi:hypothetical protein
LTIITLVTPGWSQPTYNPTLSDAQFNTAGGTGALPMLMGNRNTAFGFDALTSTSTGTGNTAMGSDTLVNNNTGSSNTAVGQGVLLFNTDGFDNTATGADSLRSNTEGSNNTASGESALYSNTTGNWNTATGVFALENNLTGSDNTAVGGKALKKATGTKNIGIGFQAEASLTIGNNNIYVGNIGGGDESQTIRIGTAQEATFIAGINGVSVSGVPVMVDGNGQLGVFLSSAQYKQHIMPMDTQSDRILTLRPVTFAYRSDSAATRHYGLIAEEVAAVYPELVTHTATGELQTVKYQELIPMLLNELQRQNRELRELRALVGSAVGRSVGSPEIVAGARVPPGETDESLR